MSSVQAVIATLNQQSTNNDLRQTSNRQSNSGPDIASLRRRFGSPPDTPLQRSSHMEQKSVKEWSGSLNRSASSTSSIKKITPTPINSDKLTSPSSSIKTTLAKSNHQSLVEQLEKMTMERDQLKQQLHCQTINTPYPSACGSPNMEIPTSPLGSSLLFDMNEIDNDNANDQSKCLDYEDIIANYNHQLGTQEQQKRLVTNLQRQLAACEIGTQWMLNKYLGELERERLCTKSLGIIIQNQEDLIKTMENNNNSRRPSSLPVSTSTGKAIEQNQQHQQTLLLHSQLELQRLELDDKQETITMLANERDLLAKKMKYLSQQLSQMQSQHVEGGKCQSRHARLASMPSSGSLSSYDTTVSSAASSCLDWVTVNSMHSHHHQANAKYLNKSYTPPQTPPPRENLPPLPSSTSSSTTTPDLSPRCTLLLSPSSSWAPSFLPPGTPPSETQPPSAIDDFGKSLGHKTSMPDIRTLHEHHIHHHHHHRYEGGMENGVSRQRSFWKGWKHRLTN